ncbi:hypothetical protein [Chenggangzhangella methanolivorans]|uniref:Secreted protein n=1 Tax=Chenggangzhangella methanolivorans TaxID=1437009 RepID=A0A9E6RCC2_9HYPH|nr:hypothetical protein [Chenggangzhangella methanolivorans]QZO01632.1 hypothetical protein K6K41_09640 [Chenggangzhangella methanolivorans]
MKRLALTSAAVLAAVAALGVQAASAADMAERTREHVYERPIPRVYYQSARPTAVCRVVFLTEERGRQWPKEQRSVARCMDFR